MTLDTNTLTNTTSAQESTMNANTNTETTNTTSLTYMDMQFECECKMDKEFAGKTITAEDFGSLSKHMLLAITTWQNEHISAQDTRQVERMQERAQQPEQLTPRQMLSRAYNEALSPKQKAWLRTNNRYQGISIEAMGEAGRFKVRFDGRFNDHSRSVMGKVIAKACQANNWYCKVQSSHVYVNMHL